MARATVSDLLDRYDARDIGDLCSDNSVAVAVGDLPTDAKALAALADARGDIDSALLAGGRYTVADLAGLTGNSEAKLIRLECGRAMYYLLCRRPAHDPERLESFDKWTERQLERLRKGENIFALDAVIDAGAIDHEYPTAASTDKLNLMRDRVKHYYPSRRFPRH